MSGVSYVFKSLENSPFGPRLMEQCSAKTEMESGEYDDAGKNNVLICFVWLWNVIANSGGRTSLCANINIWPRER